MPTTPLANVPPRNGRLGGKRTVRLTATKAGNSLAIATYWLGPIGARRSAGARIDHLVASPLDSGVSRTAGSWSEPCEGGSCSWRWGWLLGGGLGVRGGVETTPSHQVVRRPPMSRADPAPVLGGATVGWDRLYSDFSRSVAPAFKSATSSSA